MKAALDDMPKRLRIVFEAREFDGLEYEEIASRLGMLVGTVKSRLFRARARLARDPRIQALR